MKKISDVPDPDFFFKLESGRIRISDKNGNIRPDPDSESGTSLVLTLNKFQISVKQNAKP